MSDTKERIRSQILNFPGVLRADYTTLWINATPQASNNLVVKLEVGFRFADSQTHARMDSALKVLGALTLIEDCRCPECVTVMVAERLQQ